MNRKSLFAIAGAAALGAFAVSSASAYVSGIVTGASGNITIADTGVTPAGQTLTAVVSIVRNTSNTPIGVHVNATPSSLTNAFSAGANTTCMGSSKNGPIYRAISTSKTNKKGLTDGDVHLVCLSTEKTLAGSGWIDDL
jgi:hypothetical protein